MNLIFMKPRSINVDLFTHDAGVYKYAKPELARHFAPEWWKRLPKVIQGESSFPAPTMKTCAGFIDLYKHGFMFQMWCDLYIRVESNGEYVWKFIDDKSSARIHSPQQAGDLFIKNNMRNLKLINPWLAVTKENVHWVINQPMWSQDLQREIVIPPAVVEFQYQNTTAINTLIAEINRPREFVIPFGMPLVHYIPVDNRSVKLHLHLVSDDEYKRIEDLNYPRAFSNSYRKKIRAAKEASA